MLHHIAASQVNIDTNATSRHVMLRHVASDRGKPSQYLQLCHVNIYSYATSRHVAYHGATQLSLARRNALQRKPNPNHFHPSLRHSILHYLGPGESVARDEGVGNPNAVTKAVHRGSGRHESWVGGRPPQRGFSVAEPT